MPLPTIHPGRTLLGELLERNWTLNDLAEKLGENPLFVRDFLLEYVDLTPELATKIAAATGIETSFWLNQHARHSATQHPLETVGS